MLRLSEIDLATTSESLNSFSSNNLSSPSFTSINVLVIDIHFLKLPQLPLHLNPA